MERSAIISPCGQYRYRLDRRWDRFSEKLAVFVMLNPSTADAEIDDPTIRRCISFAKGWNCAGLVVVNLFAYRATKPSALKSAADPVGPENMRHIMDAVSPHGAAVAAWGAHPEARKQAATVIDAVTAVVPLRCLGCTKAGYPRHPLYVPATQQLEPFANRREDRDDA